MACAAVRGPSLKVAVSRPRLSATVFAPETTVRPPSRPVKLTRTSPVAGPLTCTTSSRPRSVSLTWMVAFGAEEPSPAPEPPPEPEPPPPKLPAGTVSVVCAALAAVPLPAALVSQTARLQLPGPGTVTVAGPAAGAAVRALQAPEPLTGQT